MKFSFLTFGFVSSLIFFSSHSFAQQYMIELIVFESKTPALWLSEQWAAVPATLEATDKEVSLAAPTLGRQVLSESQLSLKEVAKKLSSTGEYAILTHLAWTQPAEAKESAQATRIPSDTSRNGLPLDVKVTLHKQKYEHISIEMHCSKKIPESIASDFALQQQKPLSVLNNQWRFRLNESKKIKPNELTYFDHPMCGVLVMLRPY